MSSPQKTSLNKTYLKGAWRGDFHGVVDERAESTRVVRRGIEVDAMTVTVDP